MDKSRAYLLAHPKKLAEAIKTQRMVVRAARTDCDASAAGRLKQRAAEIRAQAQRLLEQADEYEHRAEHAQDYYDTACEELQRLTRLEKIAENPQALRLAELERQIEAMREDNPELAAMLQKEIDNAR